MNAREAAQSQQKVPIGARIILRPTRHAFGPARTGAVEHGGGRGRIHQSRESELGFLLRVGRQRKIVVFDGRIFAELALEGEQRAEEQRKAARDQPRVFTARINHKRAAAFSREVHRQGAAQHRSFKLCVRQCAGGVAGQKVGEHGVTAGGANDAVDPRGVGQQQLLKPNAVRQLVADFLFPCGFVAPQLGARELPARIASSAALRCQLAADHGVVNSLGRERIHESTGIAGQHHAIGIGARERPGDRQRKRAKVGAVGLPGEQMFRLQIVDEGLVMRVMLAAQIRQIVIQLEADADVQMAGLRKNVAVTVVAANPVVNVHAVALGRAQLLLRRLFHHVDGIIALNAAGAEPGGARDDAVRAVAADDHAGAVLVDIGADAHMIGMNGHLAHESGCDFDVRPRQREQQIVEFAAPDHQVQRIGRSVIHHKARRRFEMDLAHPAGGDARERVLQIRKSRQGPRADSAAARLIARKSALVEQQRRDAGFAQDLSGGRARRSRAGDDDIEGRHSS